MAEERKPYEEWTKETRQAFQTVVDEIVRSSTMQGQILIFIIATLRVLVEKGLLKIEEVHEWIELANEHGLGILGVDLAIGEVSAEERYAQEGAQLWDGKTRLPE